MGIFQTSPPLPLSVCLSSSSFLLFLSTWGEYLSTGSKKLSQNPNLTSLIKKLMLMQMICQRFVKGFPSSLFSLSFSSPPSHHLIPFQSLKRLLQKKKMVEEKGKKPQKRKKQQQQQQQSNPGFLSLLLPQKAPSPLTHSRLPLTNPP